MHRISNSHFIQLNIWCQDFKEKQQLKQSGRVLGAGYDPIWLIKKKYNLYFENDKFI